MHLRTTKILLVEDDEEDYLITRDLLEDIEAWHADLTWVSTYDAAVEAIDRHEHDVYLVDYRLGEHDGLDLLHRAIEGGCTAPMILLTGMRDHEIDLAAMKAGAADYLTKGRIDPDQLERCIRYALERAHHRQLLNQANDELQQKNTRLSELTDTAHRFVDNVAHEFRTPLTVIKEFSSIISDGLGGPVTEDQGRYLQFITAATRDLAQMVTDFLDSSKLKAGSLRVDRQSHTVEDLLASVRPMLQIRAEEKNTAIQIQIQPGIDPVFADLEKVGRVIINLAVNAIKFSPEGSGIELWAKPLPEGGAAIGITDQGAGLSEEDVKVIFERFKQVGDVQRASTKGFGLGLNIAKELIWLNLGWVDVQSQLGRGSTFSFTLPPDQPSVVVGRYFDRLAELDSPPTDLAMLCVDYPLADEDDQARQFLASVCYPMDLILPVAGSALAVAIGPTTKPEGWVKRLHAVFNAQPGQDATNGLSIRHVGQWPYPKSNQALAQAVTTALTPQSPGQPSPHDRAKPTHDSTTSPNPPTQDPPQV